MKNIFSIFAFVVLMFASLGCGLVGNLEDEAVNVAVGDSKVGIKECDDVIETLTKQVNDPEDGIVAKGIKRAALNQIRERLKQSLEDNQTNKQSVAEFCREFQKSLADSSSNSNTNQSRK